MLLAYSKERGLRGWHRVNTLAASLGILYERKTQLKQKSDRTGRGFSHDGSCLSLWKADDPEDCVFGKPGDEEDNGGTCVRQDQPN
jgi:hypothetical protein